MGGKDWRHFDWIMVGAFLLLCVIGGVEIYYSTQVGGVSPYLYRHLIRIGLGLALFALALLFDYRLLFNHAAVIYLFFMGLLVFVLLFGVEIRNSKSWLQLGGVNFQPSELVKIVVIIALAKYLSEQTDQYLKPMAVLLSGAIAFVPVALIILQHDLGTALTLMPVYFGMLILGGIRKRVIVIAGLILCIALGGSWFVLRGYQKERILSVIDPQRDPRGTGYQTIQSVIAVGSGGFTGRGLGHGSQGALGFLPERHTDFIFAVVAEEMGFLGAAAVLLLYGIILYRGLNIAFETRDRTAMYAAAGIVMLYAVHLAINMGMTLGLLPVIGIPLPPLSYGGSSVVTSFIALGLLNNFQIHRYYV
jgi:rod shape determining protein RodA